MQPDDPTHTIACRRRALPQREGRRGNTSPAICLVSWRSGQAWPSRSGRFEFVPDAATPTSIVCRTGTARRKASDHARHRTSAVTCPCALSGRSAVSLESVRQTLRRTSRRRDPRVAGRIGRVRSAGRFAKTRTPRPSRHAAERCVSRVVELVRRGRRGSPARKVSRDLRYVAKRSTELTGLSE